MRRLPSLLFFALFFLAAGTAFGQQRTEISIQGTLKDGSGLAVSDGQRQATFRLYTEASGGTAIWEETATIEVIGGVYSHNLGSVEELVEGDFESTVYLGVTFGGSELSPRTQMTYAPYALSVFAAQRIARQGCSGQVGDIKYSILNPTQFADENGDCWVPMDGRAIPGTRLAQIMGAANVPDMSGLFIRATEYNDGNDPGRSPLAAATVQNHAFQDHQHYIDISTLSAGNHSHTFDEEGVYLAGPSGTGTSTNASLYYSITNTNQSTSTTGSHTHTIRDWSDNAGRSSGSINTDVAETRPTNMNFYIYIRVD